MPDVSEESTNFISSVYILTHFSGLEAEAERGGNVVRNEQQK
jgi:hypothetical protein